MNIKGLGTIKASSIIKLAAFMIIFAVIIYAKSIIAPFLLALFINIISMQKNTWLEKKRIPSWLAIFLGTPDEAKAYLQNQELYHKTKT